MFFVSWWRQNRPLPGFFVRVPGRERGFDVCRLSQCKKFQDKKQAKEHDLERIIFVVKDRTYPNLSNKAGAVLSFMIALFRLNYSGITACNHSILQTIEKTGYHMSERTLYRALSELESLGFFKRSKFRVSHDHFKTKIEFIDDRFSFFKKSTTPSPVAQTHTQSHISSYMPNWQESPRTKINIHVNSSNSSSKELNKPRARASNFKNWIHPVLFSLMCVLKREKDRDRSYLISRARFEIEAEGRGLNIAGSSGVDWSRPHWQEMPHNQRESIIRQEILPALRSTSSVEAATNGVAELISAMFAEPIREVYRPVDLQAEKKDPPKVPIIDLPPEDLRILQDARSRAALKRHG